LFARALLTAAPNRLLRNAKFRTGPYFGFNPSSVSPQCPDDHQALE
jgi:hypothetical protein